MHDLGSKDEAPLSEVVPLWVGVDPHAFVFMESVPEWIEKLRLQPRRATTRITSSPL